jgi:hypothetical protein
MSTGRALSQVKYLKRSVKTRWNSDLISAKSYLELRSHVETAAKRHGYEGPKPLDPAELAIVEDFVSLLDSVNEVTETLSGENYVTGRHFKIDFCRQEAIRVINHPMNLV